MMNLKEINENPFFNYESWGTNLFANTIPFDEIKTEHLMPAFEEGLKRSKAEFEAIIHNPEEPTFENSVHALFVGDEMMGLAHSVAEIFSMLKFKKDLTPIIQKMNKKSKDFSNEVWQNKKLFERVKAVYEARGSLDLSVEEMTVLTETFDVFRRKGFFLSETAQDKYREITAKLVSCSQDFEDNLKNEAEEYHPNFTKEELDGLSESTLKGLRGNVLARLEKEFMEKHGIKTDKDWDKVPKEELAAYEAMAREDNEELGYEITMNSRILGNDIMPYLKSRELRKQLWLDANEYGTSSNQENIKTIVNLKRKMANLLDYKTYSDFALEKVMAKKPENVMSLLDELKEKAMPFAKKEMQELCEFAKEVEGEDFVLMQWDYAMYYEKLRQKKYSFSEEEVADYFVLDQVVPKVLNFVSKLYGVTFNEETEIPKWHKDVKVFSVWDRPVQGDGVKSATYLGLIYMDLYARAGQKRDEAWMWDFVTQERADGREKRPHIQLCTNLTKSDVVKMKIDNVETFVHELGHVLHGMFSQCKYEDYAGTNVRRDFVELPSQVMENFFYEKSFIKEISAHYETGEPLPDELFEKIIAAKNYGEGYATIRQLGFGYLDMGVYTLEDEFDENVLEYEERISGELNLFPKVEIPSHIMCRFTHIFSGGYSSGYYGYKWAEVLDAHAFDIMKKNNFSKEIMDSFRKNILERGATEEPDVLYKRFSGGEMPTAEPLLRRCGFIE